MYAFKKPLLLLLAGLALTLGCASCAGPTNAGPSGPGYSTGGYQGGGTMTSAILGRHRGMGGGR